MKPQSSAEVKKRRIYRVVQFKKQSRACKEQGFIEGIVEVKRKPKGLKVEIRKWKNWDKSFHIQFTDYDGRYIIVDSGVIEQLATEIQYRKKNGLGKDVFDGLIILNHKGEYY